MGSNCEQRLHRSKEKRNFEHNSGVLRILNRQKMRTDFIILSGIFAVLFLTAEPIKCDNILFLSLPFFSHIHPMTSLAKELHKRGHNSYIPVTQELTKKLKTPEGVHLLRMPEKIKMEEFTMISLNCFSQKSTYSFGDVMKANWEVCDNLLLNEKWFQELKSINASLAVVDGVFMSNCLAIIAYKLSIPFVFMGSMNVPALHRSPWVYSAFPYTLTTYSERMSFTERFQNTYNYFFDYIMPPLGAPGKSVQTYAPSKPAISFDELRRRAALHILDVDFLLDYAIPALPNMEYLGGMGALPADPLKGELNKFVNSSKNGIIVVSFGSVVNLLPKEHLDKMGEAFKKVKYDVVWKWSDTSYSSPNVFLTKWMPQNDLLGHPKTRLFITHCGNGGQFESLYHAVPMLGFPVFADQPHNGKRMEDKGFGISMNMHNYAVEDLVANINEIISNTKYKKNIKMASDIFKSRPESPAVRGARIVDDVIKYGGGFMRSYCQDMPLYQYFMLDILAVLLSSAFFGILIVIFILRKCFSFCCRKKEKDE